MSDSTSLPSFPRGALIGAGSLIAFALALATWGRMHGSDMSMKGAPVVMERNLRFADLADGTVGVTNADTGQLVNIIGQGKDNFVRATMRGLVQQRKRADFGPGVPFRLTRYADGRLTLTDPDTRRDVELEAFGITNEEAFAHLLTDNGPTAPSAPAPAGSSQ
jgi:putative photosynthetic complex assembly protein